MVIPRPFRYSRKTSTWRCASLSSAPSKTTSSTKGRTGIFHDSFTLMTLVCSSFLSGCCSKHKLDSTGDKGSLCFTPLRIVISTPMSSLVLNDVLWPSYNQFSMNSTIGVGTPVLAKQGFSAEWGTVSNALEIYSQL